MPTFPALTLDELEKRDWRIAAAINQAKFAEARRRRHAAEMEFERRVELLKTRQQFEGQE
jgi:hypothetical protein